MSRVFVDTSAILAVLVRDDSAHREAVKVFELLKIREAPLVTSSYVLVETYALLARRTGLESVRRFRAEFVPLFDVFWVGLETHEKALDLWLASNRRRLSLVDVVSFVVARSLGINDVFAFDLHFKEEGFNLL